MNKEYIEMIKGALSDPTTITPDKLQAILGKTMTQLMVLQEKIHSIDPVVRQDGLKEAVDLRKVLEEQMEHLGGLLGMNSAQLESVSGSMISEMTPERVLLEEAKERFLNLKAGGFSPKKRKKVTNKINLVG